MLVDTITIEVRPEDDLSLPDGRRLVEEESVEEFDGPATLEGAKFLEGYEAWINGEEMLERAKKLGDCAGLRHAKALLRQQNLIPANWQEKILVFAGTVARGSDGHRDVAYLCWYVYRWDLFWSCRDDTFDFRFCVVRLRE